MLDFAYGPILAVKSLKTRFFGKTPKKWKYLTKKKFFLFVLKHAGHNSEEILNF
jgi:hypothetical protein